MKKNQRTGFDASVVCVPEQVTIRMEQIAASMTEPPWL